MPHTNRYSQDYDKFGRMPTPDPNTFMQILFQSGILTEHQKDMIRALMMKPDQYSQMVGTTEQPQNTTGQQPAPVSPASPAGSPAGATVTKQP